MALYSNISKTLNLPESQDYNFLRSKGIEYIQQFSSKLWTDYNIHDPGITILEILCYAISDLGFRSSFPIEDILAAKPGETYLAGQTFFPAESILPTTPLTINDYRKILIDIKGVANAWLSKAPTNEISIFADLKDSELRNYSSAYSDTAERSVELKGLYDVFIEIESSYITKKDEVLESAKNKLNENRNLCEDFLSINAIDFEQIAVNAEIEIAPNADVEAIVAEIFYRIDRYISHPIRFYSLKEMIDKGVPVSSIYEGPRLTHGFIDDEDLEKSTRQFGDDNYMYTSDLVSVIMDIAEVVAVDNIWVSNYINGKLISCDNHKIKLSDTHIPKFYKEKSNITCSNGKNIYRINSELVDALFDELKSADQEAKELAELRNEESSIEIQQGNYRYLNGYKSIQENFPPCYHVGSEGISPDQTEQLKAQVKQLKGYLLFFDQLLANYLSQLENVKNLYSINNETVTYYINQAIESIPFVDDLFVDKTTYFNQLKTITEDQTTFEARRNKFLDHLLSRFSEDFSEYCLLMYRLKTNEGYAQHLIEAKSVFLSEYYTFSPSRGRAFNYSICGNSSEYTWNTGNVSGLEQKLCRSLGMKDFIRRTLSTPKPATTDSIYGSEVGIGSSMLYGTTFNEGIHIVENILLRPKYEDDIFLPICLRNPNIIKIGAGCRTDDTERFELFLDSSRKWRFRLKNASNQILLKSQQGYAIRKACIGDIQRIKIYGKAAAGYNSLATQNGRYYFNIVTDENEVLCTSNFYKTLGECDEVKTFLIELFNKADGCHDQDYNDIDPSRLDPYSYTLTVVLPSWPERCQSDSFRIYVEKLLAREAPSHVHLSIYWLDNEQMVRFEVMYKQWLENYNEPECSEKSEMKNKFIETLKYLRNVYPVSIYADEHNQLYPTTLIFDETDIESYPSVDDSTLDAL